ncbi:MAG: pilus assembly protein PilZ [Desulfobacterales bacterium]|nr:MAG: pilus assembly protein PilZ [Desulfobacterales bacterium]
MALDRRRFTRVPFRTEVRFICDGSTFVTEEMYNLSIGGCLLQIEGMRLPAAAPCTIDIRLSEMDASIRVIAEGEVVRSDEQMTAVKFNKTDPDSLYHLQNIIRYNALDTDAVDDEIGKHPGLK